MVMASNRTSKPSPLGYNLSPNSSPFGTPRSTGNMKRASSGAFTQLSSTQIQELKESFQMLDKDGDGIIGKEDLGAMLGSLGQDSTPTIINAHLSSVPTPFNLASYLTHLSQHLSLLTPGPDLLSAFAAFDDNDDGTIDVAELTEALTSMGERMSEADIERALKGFTKRRALGRGQTHGGDVFRYRDFVDVLSGKEEEKE
ncbi:EF-hand [Tuber magnatum]|uniref:EF-hand n=1 Tax=Tuber magnatum TaxID=42249 RepID=A0A317SLU1_9PEZI|nr:EF-hand [Tuber magnatum]